MWSLDPWLGVFDLPYLQQTKLSVSAAPTLDGRLFQSTEKQRNCLEDEVYFKITALEKTWFNCASVQNASGFDLVALVLALVLALVPAG